MSSFSYISFPREVNITMITCDRISLPNGFSIIDNRVLSNYNIGELCWDYATAGVRYKAFSGGQKFNPEVIEKIDFLMGLGISEDISRASFDNCFENNYIYSFGASLDYSGDSCLLKNTSDFSTRILNTFLVDVELCRKQLYKVLDYNLNKGEFVEIYSEFIEHTDFNMGPPSEEVVLTLDELISSKNLAVSDKRRIKILK